MRSVRGRPLNRPSRRRSNPNEFEYVNERSIAPCEKFRKSISYIGGVHTMGAQRDIARILRKFTRRLRCVPAVPSYGYLRSSAAPQLRRG